MFILYTGDLADMVQNSQVNFDSFADNSHIYLHCPQTRRLYLWSRPLDVSQSPEAERRQNRDSLGWLKTQAGHIWRLRSITPARRQCHKGSDHVRLLSVIIAADISLDRHVSSVCKTCFFWLFQLKQVCRSLDTESMKTLVHAFVTSRVDYCNSVLASAPKTITDEQQRVLNTAARLISCTSKYDRGLSALLHEELHWLDIPQRVQYKLAVTIHRCLRNQAPTYLTDYCVPVSDVAGRWHLRSTSCHQLTVPCVRCSTFGCHSFTSAGPSVWNSLLDNLCNSAVGQDQFWWTLKTHLFACC